jgi:hypothetical protein
MSKDRMKVSGLNRRDLLLAAAGSAPLLALASAPAEAKIAQAAVAYQQTPNGDKECDNCNFFIAPNACKTVDGEINPKGWCKIYNKKPAT